MPLVSIKYIVSFTSQDDRYPVSNLIHSEGLKKWLSSPTDRSGTMEAIFQLDKPCIISYIDMGSIWCASLEIKVGCSDWPAGREYESLVYTVSLMTPAECTLGKNPIKTQMFSSDMFCADIAKMKWDRIKVICRQPYKKMAQFGLSFLRVKSIATSDTGTKPGTKHETGSQSACVSSIKDHFLGKLNVSLDKGNNQLKSKLLKISATSDGGGGGVDNDVSLPRTAKLVLAASGPATKGFGPSSPSGLSDKVGMYSSSVDQKYAPKFEQEVDKFLFCLSFQPGELDTITIADLRHKLERKKKRKLTKEEKRLFIEKTKAYIASLYSSTSSEPGNKKTRTVQSSDTKIAASSEKENNGAGNVTEKYGANNEVNQLSKQNGDIRNSNHKTKDLNTKHNRDSNIPIQNKKKSACESGEINEISKRKLDINDSVTPPAKRVKTALSSRQQIKSAEGNSAVAVVKNGVMNQIQKVFSVIKNVTIGQDESTPARTPFEYKGLRRTAVKDEEKSKEPKFISSADPRNSGGKPSVSKSLMKELCDSDDDAVYMLSDTSTMDDISTKTPSQGQTTKNSGRGRVKNSSQGQGIKKMDCSDFFLSSDSDDDDLDLSQSFQTPAIRGRGQTRGRGRGRGQNKGKSVNKPDTPDVDNASPRTTPAGFIKCSGCGDYFSKALLSAHKQRCASLKKKVVKSDLDTDLANTPKGRGRGKRSKSSISSLEVRPTGFMKCDGCNEYFGPSLLPIHQSTCILFMTRQTPNKSATSSPWMCAKPSPKSVSTHSIGQSAKKDQKAAKEFTNQQVRYKSESAICSSNSVTMKSPPWLLAAEKRLAKLGSGKVESTNTQQTENCGNLQTNVLSKNLSMDVSAASVTKSQRKALSNQSVKGKTGSQQTASRACTPSSNKVKHSTSFKEITFDLAPSSDSESEAEVHVSNTRDRQEFDESSIQVECPLCGDFYPSVIIEQHAAVCLL